MTAHLTPPRRRRNAPKSFNVATDLDDLLEAVDAAVARDGHTSSTSDAYRYQFNRYASWCAERGFDPWRYSPTLVAAFIVDRLAPCSASSVKGVFWGVSHHWHVKRGHPRIVVARGTLAGRLATGIARSQTAPQRGGARALDVTEWAQLLGVAAPKPKPVVAAFRAALLLAHQARVPLSAKALDGVNATDVRLAGDKSHVSVKLRDDEILMGATRGPACPVAAWSQLLADGWTGWAAEDIKLIAKKVRRMTRIHAPALRLPDAPAASQPLNTTMEADDVLRMCWLVNQPLMLWLRDQTVLVWQLLGGFRPSELTVLTTRDARITTSDEVGEAVTVHLARHKGDPGGKRGDTRSLPAAPTHPVICPVTLTRTWWWLMGITDGDPVFPKGASKTIYLTAAHTPFTDEGALHAFASPIKRRANALKWDTGRLAATTGRHSLATDAVAAGADLIAIADHLGHSEVRSTSHYVAKANRRAAAAGMASAIRHTTPKELR